MVSILDKFDFNDKSWDLCIADKLLAPIRGLLNGKTVNCIKNADESYTFSVPNSRQESILLLDTIEKIAELFLTIITSPLILAALLYKSVKNPDTDQQELLDRFTLAGGSNSEDKIEERDILDDNWFFNITDYVASSNYSELQQSALILGDKILQDDPDIDYLDGGLFFLSGQMIAQELSKYSTDEKFGKEITGAKKIFDEYNKWNGRFLGIMPFRYLPIAPDNLVKNLAEDLKKRIDSLEVGQSFLVPVNIKFKGGGFHSIVTRFKRDDDNSYQLNVYNVGEGSQYHLSTHKLTHVLTKKTIIAPYTFKGISLDDLGAIDDFLIPFVNHATFEKAHKDCSKFYWSLEKKFGMELLVGNEENLDISSAKTPQYSGTCTYKSPLAALKGTLSPAAYRHFIFLMKRDKWWELKNSEIPEEYLDPEHIKLRDKGESAVKKIVLKTFLAMPTDAEKVQFGMKYFSDEQRPIILGAAT